MKEEIINYKFLLKERVERELLSDLLTIVNIFIQLDKHPISECGKYSKKT